MISLLGDELGIINESRTSMEVKYEDWQKVMDIFLLLGQIRTSDIKPSLEQGSFSRDP